jgi:energy-coupling factor transporter ATP-binding protein EcfA2
MGRPKCSLEGCHAPIAFCSESATPNYQQCIHFNKQQEQNKEDRKSGNTKAIPWTGQALQPDQIHLLSHRSTPKIIGLVGSSGAGKTTYLAMLYTLLYNGKRINSWNFAGSYTLTDWELQAKSLQIKDNGKVSYPDTTPSTPDFHSLYHLALRKKRNLHDVLYADSSGEVFYKWSINVDDPSAENARWIYENAHGFLFFIDCEAIIEKKGVAKADILQLAEQVKAGLNLRPITLLWSKADLIDQIRPNIREAIEDGLKELFPNAISLQVSNSSKSDSDQLCHINNLKASELILESLNTPHSLTVMPTMDDGSDLFYQYRGSYGSK